MTNNDRLAANKGYALLLGVIILSLAIGVVVWQVSKESAWSMVFTMLTIIGAFLAIASFGKDSAMDFMPSESSYYLVSGCLVAAIGILGLVWVFVENIQVWYLVVAFIIVVALLVIYRSISKKG